MAADLEFFLPADSGVPFVSETINCIYSERFVLFAFPPQVDQQFFVKPPGYLPLILAETIIDS